MINDTKRSPVGDKNVRTEPPSASLAQEFVAFAIASGVLRFGEFKTKAGRLSPYFFNAGLFDDGAKLGLLAQFYARKLLAEERDSGLQFERECGERVGAAGEFGPEGTSLFRVDCKRQIAGRAVRERGSFQENFEPVDEGSPRHRDSPATAGDGRTTGTVEVRCAEVVHGTRFFAADGEERLRDPREQADKVRVVDVQIDRRAARRRTVRLFLPLGSVSGQSSSQATWRPPSRTLLPAPPRVLRVGDYVVSE